MTKLCPCGCQRPVNPGRTYAQKHCWIRFKAKTDRGYFSQLAKLSHRGPNARARQIKASQGARRAHQRAAIQRASKYGTKAEAWVGGYKIGYHRAWCYWKAKWERAVKQAAQKVA